MVLESRLEEAGDERSTPGPVGGRHTFFDRNVCDHSGQAEDIVGGIQWHDKDDKDDKDDHIVVRNRRMRQQSGERWDEMEDMDDEEDDERADERRRTPRRMWRRANGNPRCPRSGRQLLST